MSGNENAENDEEANRYRTLNSFIKREISENKERKNQQSTILCY